MQTSHRAQALRQSKHKSTALKHACISQLPEEETAADAGASFHVWSQHILHVTERLEDKFEVVLAGL